MAKKKNLKRSNHNLVILSLWLIGVFTLVILNYITLELIMSVAKSEIFAWSSLVGGSIYLMAGLMLLFTLDVLYLVLFLRWIFFSKEKSNNTVYLP